VWWLAVTTVGFVVATAVDIALALASTARWEAEQGAATAGHPHVALPVPGRGPAR
jgi:hypothetical protein